MSDESQARETPLSHATTYRKMQTTPGISKQQRATRSRQSFSYENHDIAIATSSSRADPVLPWLGAGCI